MVPKTQFYFDNHCLSWFISPKSGGSPSLASRVRKKKYRNYQWSSFHNWSSLIFSNSHKNMKLDLGISPWLVEFQRLQRAWGNRIHWPFRPLCFDCNCKKLQRILWNREWMYFLMKRGLAVSSLERGDLANHSTLWWFNSWVKHRLVRLMIFIPQNPPVISFLKQLVLFETFQPVWVLPFF